MDLSKFLNVNTKEYERVMGSKVVALCVKFRANLRCVVCDIGKILRDVLI